MIDTNYLWTMFWGSVFWIFWIMWFFTRKYKYRCIRVYVRFKDDKHVIWMWIWLILKNIWSDVYIYFPEEKERNGIVCKQIITYLYNKVQVWKGMYMLSGCELIDTENISLSSQNMKLGGEWAKRTSNIRSYCSSGTAYRYPELPLR
jgi:hypothetical protein